MSFSRFWFYLIIGLLVCYAGPFFLIAALAHGNPILAVLVVLACILFLAWLRKFAIGKENKQQKRFQQSQEIQQASRTAEPTLEPEVLETAPELAEPKPAPDYYIAYSSGMHKVIAFDHIYLIEGKRKCWHCGKETPVIAFGLEQYVDLEGDVYFHNNIVVASSIQPLPEKLESYLRGHYRYYRHLTQEDGECEYANNHCVYCNWVQGDSYLHGEIYDSRDGGGLFFDLNVSGNALTFYSVKLPCNVQLSCDLHIGYPLGLEPFMPPENLIIEGRFSWE